MTMTGRAAAGPARAGVAPRGRRADVVVGVGLVVLVAGTFLPWLRSGSTTRDSYSADGALRHLLTLHGVADAVLSVWPLLSLLCAVALAAVVAGLRRVGGGLAALCAVAAGAVCIRVLLIGSNALLGVAPVGPCVTLAGSALVVAGLAVSLFRRSRRIR